jgi:hypothetical protein
LYELFTSPIQVTVPPISSLKGVHPNNWSTSY